MGKTVLVTGGAKGIGREIVRMLAKENYNVLINYNKSEKDAIELKNYLIGQNCNVEIFKADINNEQEVGKMIKFCVNKFNNIDVLVNNAGISQIKAFMDLSRDEWDEMLNTNLISVFHITQKVLEGMVRHKAGCIINVSSIWGITGASCEVHYSTAKAGIIGFTKALAKEMGPSNIRVNCVAPGAINTDMNKTVTEEEWKTFLGEVPLRRFGEVIDIARCVKWLIEDNYTTGQVISPNGGYVI